MMREFRAILLVFCLLFFNIPLGVCGNIFPKDLKLSDLMPPFEIEKESPILPGEEEGNVSISIQKEDDEIDTYKDKLQDAFEQLDKFQGRY